MKKNTIIILLLVAALVIFVLVSRNQTEVAVAPGGDDTPVTQVPEDTSDCGFTLTSPVSGASVTFPLSVTGIVNNTNAASLGCSWTMFEAVAGSLVLKNENGATVATSYLGTSDEWMTTGPVNFSGTLTPANPVASGTLLTLIITEEDPSDGEAGPVSVVSVPLIAQ